MKDKKYVKTELMSAAKLGYILISIALCAVGILLIVCPTFSASLIAVICGILMIVFGAVKLIGYFSKDLYRLAFQFDLAFGIMMIAVGVIMLVHPGSLMNFISIVLGLYTLADGLFKIQMSIDAKRFGIRAWWLILIAAIVASVVGVTLVFRPSESSVVITILLGVSLLIEGLLNLCTSLAAVKIIRHQQPDYIETNDYNEI
ncbi:MAG: hypothetical protein HFE63_10740 [Clostridiales bacterium]|nr:hypothetical protein [Clostridiales bacterium]